MSAFSPRTACSPSAHQLMEAFVSTAAVLSIATRDKTGPGCRYCTHQDTSFVPQGMRRLTLFAIPNHKTPCFLFPKPLFLLPGPHFLHSAVQWLCRVTKHLTAHLRFATSILSSFGFSWLTGAGLLLPAEASPLSVRTSTKHARVLTAGSWLPTVGPWARSYFCAGIGMRFAAELVCSSILLLPGAEILSLWVKGPFHRGHMRYLHYNSYQ